MDLTYRDEKFNMKSVQHTIIKFLYFLVDMHTEAKRHIKSPQSKLIDFINRLKVSYEFDTDKSLPYSFEGLLLLIGKDRKKVYDRCIGNKYIAEPELLLEYITRESKKTTADILAAPSDLYPEELDMAFETHFEQHHASRKKTKQLVQNYFYYMMEFERYIHIICGKESFIPDQFVNSQHKQYNQYCQSVVSRQSNEEWLKTEIRAVISQLLQERELIEKKLTKGELYLYDQKLSKQLEPENIKSLVKQKLTEEVFLVKNLFADEREYDLQPNEEEQADLHYTKVKRTIKNPEALKKLNNLSISEQIYQEYMHKYVYENGGEAMSAG